MDGSTRGDKVLNEKRDYQRIRPSFESRQALRKRGFTWVLSSNVSAVRTLGQDLYIRFHNGSLYEYPNQASIFEEMINSPSKGRFVWDRLRRTNVPYSKIGTMPLDEDVPLEDEEIMQPLIPEQQIRQIEELVSSGRGIEELSVLLRGLDDYY